MPIITKDNDARVVQWIVLATFIGYSEHKDKAFVGRDNEIYFQDKSATDVRTHVGLISESSNKSDLL